MLLSSHKRGFTFVEVLVAVALFSVVVTTAAGSVLLLLGSVRRVRATELVMNNLNIALEDMTRNIRIGSVYHCDILTGTISNPRDCDFGSGGSHSSIAFEPWDGTPSVPNEEWGYRLNGTSIERAKNDGASAFFAVTAPEVEITTLDFYVFGSGNLGVDEDQPTVTIVIRGSANATGRASDRVDFDVQTTVTQRVLNI